MSKAEIIAMLRASCDKDNVDPEQNGFWVIHTPELEAFAKLVAEHEREACAKLEIELILSPAFFATMGEYDAHKDAVFAYRNLIRARGQA